MNDSLAYKFFLSASQVDSARISRATTEHGSHGESFVSAASAHSASRSVDFFAVGVF